MLEEMKTLMAVVQYKSFTKAGEAVGLSQPGVSAHIHRLEDYFGTALVTRNARRVQITDAGFEVFRCAEQMVTLLEETSLKIAQGSGKIYGNLHIGATLTIGECVLPKILCTFQQKYPNIQLELTVENTMEIRRMVKEERIEIGFVEGIHQSDGLEEGYFMEDSLVLLTSAVHSLSDLDTVAPEMMSDEHWIAREEGSGTREYMDLYLTLNQIRPATVTVLGSNYAVMEAVKNNMGITIASERLADGNTGIRKHRFSKEYIRPFSHIVKRNKELSQAARLLLKMVDETMEG